MSGISSLVSLYKKRLKNILFWIKSGDFRKLWQAIKDQFWIKSTPIRRLARKYLFVKRRKQRTLKRLLNSKFGYGPKEKGINVAVITEEGLTHPKSSAFIRLISPLTDSVLQETLGIKLYNHNATSLDSTTDVCVVQRTAYSNERIASKLINFLQKNGIPLIVDNDDAFHAIDESHPEHSKQLGKTKALNKLVMSADQIWLSVPELMSSYKNAPGRKIVVPNSLDQRLWKKNSEVQKRPEGPVRMIYMGTVTHDADLEMILPTLIKLADTYPGKFILTIIGVSGSLPDLPWIERIYQPRNGSIYPNFVEWFLEQGPFDIGLSPLVDSAFNQGKSDIKCLDYLAASILPVVSDILPYQSPDINDFIIKVKNTPEQWRKTLEELVTNPAATREEALKKVRAGQKYIWSQRSSHTAATQIKGLIDELLEIKS